MCLKKLISLMLSCVILILAFPLCSFAASDTYLYDTIEKYAEYDYSDPYDISDEDFFGVWENDSWVKEPDFKYDDYPGLEGVSNAAKVGDYELCKEELLEYYRVALRARPVEIGSSNSKANEMAAELYAHNFFQLTNLIQKVSLKADADWYTVNITSNVRGVRSKTAKNLTIGTVALNKDGYTARIASKETELTDISGKSVVPYVLVNVNGEERIYYPSDDTYISADININTSFGDMPWVETEESTSTIESILKWDSYTKKGFLKFEFNDIKRDDVINLAELHIYGDYVVSDNPDNIADEITEKHIYLHAPAEEVWNEDTLTWKTKTASVGVSYDKEAGPTAYEAGDSLGTNWKSTYTAGTWEQVIGQMYEETGNEAYAYHAIRLLLHNVKLIDGDYFIRNSGVFFVGNRLIRVTNALYCLINSPYMTADAFTAIMKNMYGNFEWLSKNWGAGFENSNLGVIPLTEGIKAGLAFPEFTPMLGEKLEYTGKSPAFYVGDWLITYFKRLSVLMNDYIQEDGSSKDISLEYVLYVFRNVLELYTTCARYDFDCEPYLPGLLDKMDSNANFIVSKLTPKFTYWQNGDDSTYTSWVGPQKALQQYLQVRENPYVRYVAYGRKEGTPPLYDMSVSDIMKFAIMRSSWDENAVSAHINADGGTIHGHADDLHLSVFAYGQYLLVDPLNYSYNRTSAYNMWFEATTGHNAVEINGSNQKGYTSYTLPSYENILGDTIKVPTGSFGVRGDMHEENRENNAVYDFVSAETFNYIDNNAMNGDFENFRNILFIKPGYFIVTDYMKPENSEINVYKQNWHFLPEANISLLENGNTVTDFEGTANIIIAPVNYDDGMLPSIEDGFFAFTTNSGNITSAKGSRYTKKQAGVTTFNTLLYPVPAGVNAEVSTEPLLLDVPNTVANAATATITDSVAGTKQIAYYTLFDDSQKAERVFGVYETDGTLAFAEKTNSKISTALVRGGSYLKSSDGKFLIKSEEDMSDLGVSYDYNSNSVIIGSDADPDGDTINIEKLTIFCDMQNISEVIFEGNPVNFKRSGNYLYFGDVPIINDGEDPDGENSSGGSLEKPGHSTGGGGGSSSSVESSISDSKKEEKEEKPIATEKVQYENEIKGHWGENEIRAMILGGIIQGDGNSLYLSNNVTRAEFLTMLLRAMEKDLDSYGGCFKDVSADKWYADCIQTAYNLGWINGDGNGNALPEAKITREEMAKILVTVLGKLDSSATTLEIADSEDVSLWAEKYVSIAMQIGLMQGSNGMFYPKNSAKREEAIVVLYRALNGAN